MTLRLKELKYRYETGTKLTKPAKKRIKEELKRECTKRGCHESLAFRRHATSLCAEHSKTLVVYASKVGDKPTVKKVVKKPRKRKVCALKGCLKNTATPARSYCSNEHMEESYKAVLQTRRVERGPVKEGPSRLKTCQQCHMKRKINKSRKICAGCRRFNGKVARGEVKTPDYKDVHIDGYKQPMQAVEDGFGYYGAVVTTNDDNGLQCHLCGYYFANLGGHITFKHEMNLKDYKVTYGLRVGDGLVAPNLRSELQARYNTTLRVDALKNAKKAQARTAQLRKDGKLKPGGSTWTAQGRNEKGNCRAQTLAKIQQLAELQDGVVSMVDFEREYGSGQHSTIEHWFGNWKNAVKEAGVKSFEDHRQESVENRIADAIEGTQRFYEENGRVPQSADYNSTTYLPSHGYVSKRFGSMNNLREIAGVPKIVNTGRRWEEEKL